jgi:hypothetical protein
MAISKFLRWGQSQELDESNQSDRGGYISSSISDVESTYVPINTEQTSDMAICVQTGLVSSIYLILLAMSVGPTERKLDTHWFDSIPTSLSVPIKYNYRSRSSCVTRAHMQSSNRKHYNRILPTIFCSTSNSATALTVPEGRCITQLFRQISNGDGYNKANTH